MRLINIKLVKKKVNRIAHKKAESITKHIISSIIVFLMLILLIKNATALGIIPSERVFKYIPEKIETGSVTILNNLRAKIKVELSYEGPLNVTFPKGKSFIILPLQRVSVPLKIKLPKENTIYGKVCSIVWAKRIPITKTGISATERVGSKFCTEIPYPGKYLELYVEPKNVNVGTPTTVVMVKYSSKGKEIIHSIKSKLYILTKNQTLLKTYDVKEINDLFTGAEETIPVEIETKDLKGGEYLIKVETYYDGKKVTKTATLTIGYPDVEIVKYSKDLASNFADEFKIYVKNKYLSDFKIVYAEIIIYNGNQQLSYSTAPITLKSGSYGILKTVIPTQNLKVGDYKIKIIINFDNKKKEINGNIFVTEKTQPKKEKQEPTNYSKIITAVVIINATILLILLVLILFKKEKIKEDEL